LSRVADDARHGKESMMTDVEERPLVLIIEDDEETASALSMLLKDWGYAYAMADSAAAAVRALGPHVKEVRALITDFHLEDGFTGITGACAVAKAIGHPIPTLVTTGFVDLEPYLAKSFPVLSKPFDPTVLHQWLSLHIEAENRVSLDEGL
jgi:DNA-binding NtrC family response regulator